MDCMELHDGEPDCNSCRPEIREDNALVIEASGRYSPLLMDGMGGINVDGLHHAIVAIGGDAEDAELLAEYLSAYQRELRRKREEGTGHGGNP